jgi:hypothetical protein
MLFAQANRIEDLIFCKKVVDTYRISFDRVSGAWKELDRQLLAMSIGQSRVPDIAGPMQWMTDRVTMPSGFSLKYPSIQRSTSKRGLVYKRHTKTNGATGGFESIWGGTLLENLGQSLSLIHI